MFFLCVADGRSCSGDKGITLSHEEHMLPSKTYDEAWKIASLVRMRVRGGLPRREKYQILCDNFY